MFRQRHLQCGCGTRTSVKSSAAGGRRYPGNESPLLLGRQGSKPSTGSTGKLILPNQGGESGPRRIVLPDNVNPANAGPAPTQLNKFRPPQGFMDEDSVQVDKVDTHAGVAPEQLLQRLATRQGSWPIQAKMVLSLQSKGVEAATIFQAAGITGADQSALMIAGTILDSLRTSGTIAPGMLAELEVEDGWTRLFPLRFLGAEPRAAAAVYIIQSSMIAETCEVLARSMKEWERRPTEREGFSDHPADCLAFKYYRDALESRRPEERAARVQQGLEVAQTNPARARLQDLITEKPKEVRDEKAVLTVVRLSPDELGFRPVALLKELGQASAADLAVAPKTRQEGAFGSFMLDSAAANHRWVALPMWRALAMSRHPVAMSVADCAKVPSIATATRCSTEDDRRRLSGAGLLVADVADIPEPADAADDTYYLVVDAATEALTFASGRRVRDGSAGRIVATVLFLARPPQNEYVGSGGSEMLQV